MKKIFISLLIAIIAPMLFSIGVLANDTSLRGVWVSTVYNLDFPSSATTDSTRLKSDIDTIVSNCVDMGYTAIFLQVRPCSDALYPSSIYPWSKFLTGKNGQAPSGGFDPLSYWITKCHFEGIELHAWLNPYRITTGGSSELNSLAENHPAKLHPEWIVKYTDGNYYFDPAIPGVRQLVIDGAEEILVNYDVDGIHIDDYFYPGKDFNDSASYSLYGGASFASKADWRRNNVDLLVKGLYDMCHRYGTVFGVSPCGIWENKGNNPNGSNTNGRSAYSEMYADTRGWVLKEYVDYIAPQIYWENGNKSADYNTLAKWWANVCKDTNVKLYIGLADYKSVDVAASSPWYGGQEIKNQMEYNMNDSVIDGEIHFRYKIINGNSALKNVIRTHYDTYPVVPDVQPVLPSEPLLPPVRDDVPEVTVPEDVITPPMEEIPTEPIIPNVPSFEPKPDMPPLYDDYTVAEQDIIKVLLNGKYLEMDTNPVIINDRTLVPMRAIFEALGAKVSWDGATSTATAVKGFEKMTVQIGATYLTKDGKVYNLDSPARIVNSRTLVPVRAISEAFGFSVGWDGNSRTVIINE